MNIYESVYKYCKMLGHSEKQINRALGIIAQMEAKGYIDKTDLRRQLGDIIPGIVQITAKSLNCTVEELYRALDIKMLTSPFVFNKLSEELDRIIGIFVNNKKKTNHIPDFTIGGVFSKKQSDPFIEKAIKDSS
jgi:tape measure domain-containing protein